MDTSLGKILYDIRSADSARTGGGFFVTWEALARATQESWQRTAEQFFQALKEQSTQHFSQRAEVAVRDLRTAYRQYGVLLPSHLDLELMTLFDLLPDPDAELKSAIKRMVDSRHRGEDIGMSDDMAKEIIEFVREHDKEKS